MDITQVLRAPHQTEKTTSQAGKVAFVVHTEATKTDVKAAVKSFYGIEAEQIRMITQKKKVSDFGRRIRTRRAERKIAYVSLPAGKTLNFNDYK